MNVALIDLFYANEEWAELRRPGAVEFVQKRLSALQENPLGSTHLARVGLGPDPRRALGQRPSGPHQRAGHMTAPDQCCINVKKLCQSGAVHT
jgi:hypothetical protein